MPQEKPAATAGAPISPKMGQARDRLTAEIKGLTDLVQREIVEARDWPPLPEVSAGIKQRTLELGARAVKLLEAVDKIETARARAEEENAQLSAQIHDLRMKSSGITTAEFSHLKMENEVLKEHIQQLEAAIAAPGTNRVALEAENARLSSQLKELENEVNRLLGESADAMQAKEEAARLREEAGKLRAELEAAKADAARPAAPGPGGGVLLASVWDSETEPGGEEDLRTASLKARIADLEAEHRQAAEKARRKIETVSRERDELARKVAELAESAALRAEQAIAEINELHEERDRLGKDLEKARAAAAEAAPGAGALREEAESLRLEVEALRNRPAPPAADAAELAALQGEAGRLREENARLREGAAQAPAPAGGAPPGPGVEERERLAAELREAEKKAEALGEEARKLREKSAAIEAERDWIREDYEKLKAGQSAPASMSGAIQAFHRQIATTEKELKEARKALNESVVESGRLREEISNLFQSWERAEEEARRAREEKAAAESREAELQRRIQEGGAPAPPAEGVPAEEMKKVVDSLERYIGELEADLDRKETEIERLLGMEPGGKETGPAPAEGAADAGAPPPAPAAEGPPRGNGEGGKPASDGPPSPAVEKKPEPRADTGDVDVQPCGEVTIEEPGEKPKPEGGD